MSLATSNTPLPDDLDQLRALLLQERAAHAKTKSDFRKKLHSLLEEMRLDKQRLYGSSSEKSPDQTELFDEADVPAETSSEITDSQTTPVAAHSRKKKVGRKPLPSDLPRVRKVIELSDEERPLCQASCRVHF